MPRIRGLAAMSAPRCAALATSHPLLYPVLDWPAQSGSLQAVLRESLEEPLTRPLPTCIQDFGSSFLLKNCVTVHPADVVDSTDAKTLAEKSKNSVCGS